MKNLKITKDVLLILSSLLPVLKRNTNEHGVIPFNSQIDETAYSMVSMMIQNKMVIGNNLSVSRVSNCLLKDNWVLLK